MQEDRCKEVLILSGDQLYRMDFRQLLKTHRETNADVTIAVLPVPEDQTPGFGIIRLNDAGRVIGFVEKPQNARTTGPGAYTRRWIEKLGSRRRAANYLASMGIYLFKRDVLIDLLTEPPLATDFGKEMFPRSLAGRLVQAHVFDGYWEDLGTIKSYHEANLALAGDDPPFDFHRPEGVIYTRMRFLPASRISAPVFRSAWSATAASCGLVPGSSGR